MAAALTATGSWRLTGDPAVLRYHWRDGRPVYRAGRVPGSLATARQLRTLGLSRAGLKPAGWLHYCAYHYLGPLYETAAARPVRPLTGRQRQALAAGRKLANTMPCNRCGPVRVPAWGNRLCEDCEPIAEAEWYAARDRRQRDADDALARQIAADQAAAARWAAGFLADPCAVVLDTVIRADGCLSDRQGTLRPSASAGGPAAGLRAVSRASGEGLPAGVARTASQPITGCASRTSRPSLEIWRGFSGRRCC